MTSTAVSQKRRKLEEGKQTHVPLNSSKQIDDRMLYLYENINKASTKSVKEAMGINMFSSQMEGSFSQGSSGAAFAFDQGGINQKGSPYRSTNRVKKLLSSSTPYKGQNGTESACMHEQTPVPRILQTVSKRQNLYKKNGMYPGESKPSSVTTACTNAPNEMSATKSVTSSRFLNSGVKRKRTGTETVINSTIQNDKQKKKTTNKELVGSKRNADFGTEPLEYLTKLNNKTAKLIAESFKLKNKRTGEEVPFTMYKEKMLPHLMDNAVVTNFNMNKLEIEYDYDTDLETIQHSHQMLLRELGQAIDFYVNEDPIKLVDNVLLYYKL